jgi:hypothetical protein
MKPVKPNFSREISFAKSLYRDLPKPALCSLKQLLLKTGLSVISGEVIRIDKTWYVNHAGLLGLAQRRHCFGIRSQPVSKTCDPINSRWVFKATVFKSPRCKGFTGYGDADPLNVSSLVRGAEMRIAETRAVNRALRKAYAVGICSVEEIGPVAAPDKAECQVRKAPENANGNGSRVRDRLCQLIRQHSLDAELVKAYATDFCGTKILREATRGQIENFVAHLADWAEKDRNALLCQLNSYSRQQGAA